MTIEELEAKLETVSRERDDAHARWVAIINNRGTTISDAETLTNELNIALSQRDKVRVELREARILTQEIGDACRGKREPSKGAAIILGPLLRERDVAQDSAAMFERDWKDACRERDKFQALAELGDGYRRERDEARAEMRLIAESLQDLMKAYAKVYDALESEREVVASQNIKLAEARRMYGEESRTSQSFMSDLVMRPAFWRKQ